MALIDKADQLYTHTNLDWDWSLQTSSHAATTLNTTTRLTASKSRSRPASVFRFKARDPARANCTWPAEHTSVLAFPGAGCFHRLQCSALRMHADAWLFLLDPIFEVCPALCTLHNHATPAHTCARPRCTTSLHPRMQIIRALLSRSVPSSAQRSASVCARYTESRSAWPCAGSMLPHSGNAPWGTGVGGMNRGLAHVHDRQSVPRCCRHTVA